MSVDNKRLKITEIFFSLQGESRTVGMPTVFVRLTGCPLRCQYCDTAYAFTGGQWMAFDEIIKVIKSYETNYITVKGGEPLAQSQCLDLLKSLCDLDYQVSIETSGALDISDVDQRVSKVMDIKTPGSKEESKNKLGNIEYLTQNDEVKFVICNEADYEWSRKMVDDYQLSDKCGVLFSPSHDEQNATQLAEWVLRDQLSVRMQVQLHKYLWGNVAGK